MDEAILSGLYGLRATSPGWPDLIAALALGLLFAGALGAIATVFRKPVQRSQIAERLAHARALQDPNRVIALSGILKDLTDLKTVGSTPWPERAASAFDLDPMAVSHLSRLYQPGPLPDAEALERAILMAERY